MGGSWVIPSVTSLTDRSVHQYTWICTQNLVINRNFYLHAALALVTSMAMANAKTKITG